MNWKEALKDLTAEILGQNRPDLVEQLKKDAVAAEKEALAKEAGAAERTRVLSILKIADVAEFSGEDYRQVLNKSIESGDSLEAAQLKCNEKRLSVLHVAAPQTAGMGNGDSQATQIEQMPEGPEKWEAQFNASQEIRDQYRMGGLKSYLAYKRAESRGLISHATRK